MGSLIINPREPKEERSHDWKLYTRSGIDETIRKFLLIEGRKYLIYLDKG